MTPLLPVHDGVMATALASARQDGIAAARAAFLAAVEAEVERLKLGRGPIEAAYREAVFIAGLLRFLDVPLPEDA